MMGVSVTPVFYIFECGCRVAPENIMRYHKWIAGKEVNQIHCPDHPGKRIFGYICKCEMCGKLSDGPRSKMCPECRYEEKKRKMREKARLYYPMKKRMVKIGPKQSLDLYDPDRWNCANRAECLDEYWQYACLPCKGCKKYQLQHGDVDPLGRCFAA